MEIVFVIPMTVEPKQGDRSRVVERPGGRPFVMHYQPARVRNNAEQLAAIAGQHRPPRPFEGPVGVEMEFRYPWRKGDSKRARARGAALKATRPDLDNLEKNVLDVLQRSGFFRDDAQVAEKRSVKLFADQALVRIRVKELDAA